MASSSSSEYARPALPAFCEVSHSGVVLDGVSPKLLAFVGELAQIHLHLYDKPVIITSGREGSHTAGSKHYEGEALDLRSEDLTPEEQVLWAAVLAYKARPAGIGVFDERALTGAPHWHVELAG